jgi:hypothetical protein
VLERADGAAEPWPELADTEPSVSG